MARGDQELLAIDQLARRYADKELAPLALHADRYPFEPWNHHAWQAASELGLVGLALPESHGGTAQGALAFARTLEIVAAADASQATLLLTQALSRATLIALGPAELSRRVATLRGDATETLLAYPLYDDPEEPAAGVTARVLGDGYVLDGELAHVACLPIAAHVIVPALIDKQQAFFLIEPSLSGCTLGEPIPTLGLHACPVADLALKAARVSASARLGGSDAGSVFAAAAEAYRTALVAVSLGVLRGSFELAFNYARGRKQAKKMIVEHHMVQEMLSDMLCTYEVGMLALEVACADGNNPTPTDTRLIALQQLATGLVTRRTTDGVQVLGGNGYMHDYGQEKRMRDAKQLQVVFGSSVTRRLRVIERRLKREE